MQYENICFSILTGGVKRFLLKRWDAYHARELVKPTTSLKITDAMLFFYHSKTKLLLLISLSPVSFPFNFLNIQNREWSILIVNIRHWNICFFCLFVCFVLFIYFSSPVNVCFDLNISNLLFFSFYRFFLYFLFRLSGNFLI